MYCKLYLRAHTHTYRHCTTQHQKKFYRNFFKSSCEYTILSSLSVWNWNAKNRDKIKMIMIMCELLLSFLFYFKLQYVYIILIPSTFNSVILIHIVTLESLWFTFCEYQLGVSYVLIIILVIFGQFISFYFTKRKQTKNHTKHKNYFSSENFSVLVIGA